MQVLPNVIHSLLSSLSSCSNAIHMTIDLDSHYIFQPRQADDMSGYAYDMSLSKSATQEDILSRHACRNLATLTWSSCHRNCFIVHMSKNKEAYLLHRPCRPEH